MKHALIASAITATLLAGSASAATLGGTFTFDIYQKTSASKAGSKATEANLASSTFLDSITYKGDLDFGTNNGNKTTISDWLSSGVNGSVFGLSAAVADMQLSKSNINKNSATTTFFDITANFKSGFDSMVRHDDGISVFDDGAEIASFSNPTTVRTTIANGFDGGQWRMIYAATNNDPSILEVTGDNFPAPIPLPAGGLLLLSGLGAVAALRRRKSAS